VSVLVTGGTGFVGLNMCKLLAERGVKSVCFGRSAKREDKLRDWYLEDVQDMVYMYPGDVLEPEQIREAMERYDVDKIVHTATITPSADVARERANFVLSVNILGTSNILDAARDMGVERVVYTSSAAVYKANSELEPVDEYDALDLNGLYPISKLASEELCTFYFDAYGLDAVSARLGWIYGPMERPMPARGGMSEVFNMVMAALDGETVKMNDLDRYRDWTHGQDTALGLFMMLEADELTESVYNLTCGESWAGYEVVELLQDLIGPFDVELVDDVAEANVPVNSRNRRGPLAIDRLTLETGFEPQIPLEEGMRTYVEWIKEARARNLF